MIKIAEDFSDAPGARYRTDGPKSGEEFFDTLLDRKFEEATKRSLKLEVDFDGTYGFATSFLSESFGRLAKKYGKEQTLNTLILTSREDPYVADWTTEQIRNSTG